MARRPAKIIIEPIDRRGNYRVIYRKRVLVEKSRDPEFDAARVLYSRGKRGKLISYANGTRSLIMDIGWAAARMTLETPARGPRTILRKEWKPSKEASPAQTSGRTAAFQNSR